MKKTIGHAALCSTLLASMLAATSTWAAMTTAVEYYHQQFEHYFVTANPTEIALLDSETLPGWYRTGVRYSVYDSPETNTAPVCRFYSDAFGGEPTHFFTASASECAQLKTNPLIIYEGIAFYATVPDGQGQCPERTVPVHRLYNGGRNGAPNHEYTPYDSKAAQLVDAGFISEGTAFCVPSSAAEAEANTQLLVGTTQYVPWYPWEMNFGPAIMATDPHDTPVSRYLTRGLPFHVGMGTGDYTSTDDPSSGGGWDPLANEYFLYAADSYNHVANNGAGWTIDMFGSNGEPQICIYEIFGNFDARYGSGLHPFQELLVSYKHRQCSGISMLP